MSELHKDLIDEMNRVELIESLRQLKQQFEVQRTALTQYRLLLDHATDPIFSFSPDGRYAYVNNAFANGIHGQTMETIIGRTIWDVFPKDEADKRFAIVRWVFENAETKQIEVRVPRPDGNQYYLTSVKPVLDEHGKVATVICISKNITERKMMEERLQHMAQYDHLTHVPNRSLFDDRLQSAIAQAKRDDLRLALMALDLDHFKTINDTYGHQVGDRLLQGVAQRIKNCLRESDTVGRIGGDEFVILLPHVDVVSDALGVADKISASLRLPFELPDCPSVLKISSSIGIAIYPEHGNNHNELAKHADHALYAAKAGGRNQTSLYCKSPDCLQMSSGSQGQEPPFPE